MTMAWLSSELLYFGGFFIMLIAVILAIIFIVVSRINLAKLKARFTAEYGEERKNRTPEK